jgi:hypothetical protein
MWHLRQHQALQTHRPRFSTATVGGKEIRCPNNAVTGPQNHSHGSYPLSQESLVPAQHALQPSVATCVVAAGGCNKQSAPVMPISKSDLPCNNKVVRPAMRQQGHTCHATTPECRSTLLNFPVAPSYAACAAQPKPSQNGHAVMPQHTRTKTSSTCTQCPPGTGRADCLLACVYAGCTHTAC